MIPLNSHALGDPPSEAGVPLDLIFVEGFRGDTVIGIDPNELHAAQPLVIDVQVGVPHVRACDTDRIGDTVHYGIVVERLRRFMAEHQVQLLEAFAESFADILITEFGAHWVRLKVVKPRKFDDVQAVGVQIERRAGDRAATGARQQRGAAVLHLIGSGMVPPRG